MAEYATMISVKNLYKDYDSGMVHALQGISMEINRGEICALMGPSGCGKSTLFNMIGALDRPTSGKIFIKGHSLQTLSLHRYRNLTTGFIFQQHHLVSSLTLLENVMLPLASRKNMNRSQRMKKAMGLLSELGIAHRASSCPAKVSGGERQRAAIARALVNNPEILLADEPTGSVDSKTADFVMNIIMLRCRKNEMTVLLATHNPEIAEKTKRILFMSDGKLITHKA